MSMEESLVLITAWLKKEGLTEILENLAPPATSDALTNFLPAEARTTSRFDELKQLYANHNGQRNELDCFFPARNFFNVRWAQRETDAFRDWGKHFIEQGGAELDSAGIHGWVEEDWWCFAGMDSDYLVQHLPSQRVFDVWHDLGWPEGLTCVAESLTAFLEQFAHDLAQGRYEPLEGFGTRYLAKTRLAKTRLAQSRLKKPRATLQASAGAENPKEKKREPQSIEVTRRRIAAIEIKALAKLHAELSGDALVAALESQTGHPTDWIEAALSE